MLGNSRPLFLRVLARTAVPHSCTTPALRLAHLTALQEDTGYNLCDECWAQDGGPMAHHARDPYCISGARGVIYGGMPDDPGACGGWMRVAAAAAAAAAPRPL